MLRPLALLFVLSCASDPVGNAGSKRGSAPAEAPRGTEAAPPPAPGEGVAIFAGGCFWCTESDFEKVDGVLKVESGYVGGKEERPTYEQVSSGGTGHAEAVRVVFDPAKTSYERLLQVFWHSVDPTQADGQFCDKGTQYRSAIFPLDEAQRAAASASLATVDAQIEAPIVTTIETPGPFWLAEDYHQDFYKTNPVRYNTYRMGCGRDARLKQVWGEAAGH